MATITTSRLHLTPFEPSDWAFFRSLREDRAIMRYMAAIAPEKETRRVFAARLMAVADTYDGLISQRVYKQAHSHDEAVAILQARRGTAGRRRNPGRACAVRRRWQC